MSSGHILVVDDDAAIREIMAEILEDESFLVTRAATGDAAVCGAARNLLDLVILDLGLPGADSHTIAPHLKVHHSGTPILGVSASPSCLPALPQPNFDVDRSKQPLFT